jgi:hypothetical protein
MMVVQLLGILKHFWTLIWVDDDDDGPAIQHLETNMPFVSQLANFTVFSHRLLY